MSMQGTLYNGQSAQGVEGQGLRIKDRRGTATEQPAVKAVILPSGETVDLR